MIARRSSRQLNDEEQRRVIGRAELSSSAAGLCHPQEAAFQLLGPLLQSCVSWERQLSSVFFIRVRHIRVRSRIGQRLRTRMFPTRIRHAISDLSLVMASFFRRVPEEQLHLPADSNAELRMCPCKSSCRPMLADNFVARNLTLNSGTRFASELLSKLIGTLDLVGREFAIERRAFDVEQSSRFALHPLRELHHRANVPLLHLFN